jgi:hypothetical protein
MVATPSEAIGPVKVNHTVGSARSGAGERTRVYVLYLRRASRGFTATGCGRLSVADSRPRRSASGLARLPRGEGILPLFSRVEGNSLVDIDKDVDVCSVNKAVVSSYQARTGNANFVEQALPEVGEIYASPVGTAGRVYFVGRDGTTQVIRNAERFEILATNKLDDKIDASRAIAGNELFLKGKQHLYCISATW